MANAQGLDIPKKPDSDTPWTGPDPTLVQVQAILFSSLAASLLSAFVAMLGKQWLNRYSQVEHGSLIDRGRNRQRKMDGMATWHFSLVMETLPVMLQVSLLLLGCALTKYLFTIDHLIAWVIAGFTAAGFLFFFLIVLAASISYNCPFQTPLSLFIRLLVRLVQCREKHLKKSKRWFLRTFPRGKRGRGKTLGGPDVLPEADEKGSSDQIEPLIMDPIPASLNFKKTELDDFVFDSNCIAWMFKMSTDGDVVLDIMRFIPEIVWHPGIQTTPMEKLYDVVLDCFDRSSGRPVLISKLSDKAYFSAKAFLHLAIHRGCMGDEVDATILGSIRKRHQNIGYEVDAARLDSIQQRHQTVGYEGNSDLESTLGMIDRIFARDKCRPMRWDKFDFSDHHSAWMGHILLYRARDIIRRTRRLPDDIEGFVIHSLGSVSTPPPVIINCLHIIELVLRIESNVDDHATQDIRLVVFLSFLERNR